MFSVKILLGVFTALVGRWLSHKQDDKVPEPLIVKLTNNYTTVKYFRNYSARKRVMVVVFPFH